MAVGDEIRFDPSLVRWSPSAVADHVDTRGRRNIINCADADRILRQSQSGNCVQPTLVESVATMSLRGQAPESTVNHKMLKRLCTFFGTVITVVARRDERQQVRKPE